MVADPKDPMGQAIWDYFFNQDPKLIYVYSDVAEGEVIKPAYLFRKYWQMPPVEKMALYHCRGKVLDIGAGAGCHSILLQERGFEVQAMESSELACEVMRKRGVSAIHKDFFDADPGEVKYDTLLLLMNGVGICRTTNGLRTFLEYAREWLKPEGHIILDSSDLRFLFDDEGLEARMAETNSYYGEVQYEMKYKNISSDPFNWLFIDFESLKQIALEQGFQVKCLYDGPDFQHLAQLSISN